MRPTNFLDAIRYYLRIQKIFYPNEEVDNLVSNGIITFLKSYNHTKDKYIYYECDKQGNTPLMLASKSKYTNYSILGDMIHFYHHIDLTSSSSLGLNKVNNNGDNALLILSNTKKNIKMEGLRNCLTELINYGINIDIVNLNGDTAFYLIIKNFNRIYHRFYYINYDIFNNNYNKRIYDSCYDPIETLFKKNVNVNTFYSEKKSLLMIAIINFDICEEYLENKYFSVIREIIINCTNLNRKDIYGNTALMYAAACKKINYVGLLIDLLFFHGAIATTKNNQGDTALIIACRNSRHSSQSISLLIKYGSDINAQNNIGISALMQSIISHSVFSHNVRTYILIEASKDQDVNLKDIEGRTAIAYAIINTNPKIVKKLIKYGADIFCKTNSGKCLMEIIADMRPNINLDIVRSIIIHIGLNEITTSNMNVTQELVMKNNIKSYERSGKKYGYYEDHLFKSAIIIITVLLIIYFCITYIHEYLVISAYF